MEEFINIVKKTGFQNIQLNSIITAVKFYKKIGFKLDNPLHITETPAMTKNLLTGGKKRNTNKNRKTSKNKISKKINKNINYRNTNIFTFQMPI